MLVTLFHNKPLTNEPGIKETHRSFNDYNRIITYKNIEIAIIRTLRQGPQSDPCRCFNSIYKQFVNKNKNNIINYIKSIKKEGLKWGKKHHSFVQTDDGDYNSLSVSLYNMTIKLYYEQMYCNAINCLENI